MSLGDRFGREKKLALHYGSPLNREPAFYQRRRLQSRFPVKLLFRLLARLPLGANHALGAFVGRLVYALSPRYRRRVLENLAASALYEPAEVARAARENAAEIGKGASELAWALFRSEESESLVVKTIGWEAVEKLRAANRPIIFATCPR